MFIRSDIPKLKRDLTIQTHLLNHDLTLKTRWGVFSPRSIDDGTLLLMKYLKVSEADKCLDLGCGYEFRDIATNKHIIFVPLVWLSFSLWH
jgi:16S rRNA G1207 methylase RsmC